jgi:hypothetical protein
VAVVGACIPGFHNVEGFACDSAHPCPDGLACIQQICSADAGSATGGGGAGGGTTTTCMSNRLTDGDFEAGPLTSMTAWTVGGTGTLTVEDTVVRNGTWAARLSSAVPATVTLSSQFGAIDVTLNGDFCAEAWVRGADAGTVTLQLMRMMTTTPDLSGTPAGSQATPTDTWQVLQNRFANPLGDINFAVQVSAPLGPGEAVYVDDVCVSLCP